MEESKLSKAQRASQSTASFCGFYSGSDFWVSVLASLSDVDTEVKYPPGSFWSVFNTAVEKPSRTAIVYEFD